MTIEMTKWTTAVPVLLATLAVFFAGCHANEQSDCGCGPVAKTEEMKEFQFGLIADVQYADKEPEGSRFYRNAMNKLAECKNDLNNRELAFVVQLGDLIDGSDDSARDLQRAAAAINEIHAPVYHVTGNHDFTGVKRADFLALTGMKEPYYTFAYGGWRFVFLDTMDVSVQGGWDAQSENYRQGLRMLAETADAGEPNAQEWNGGIGSKQIKWLRVTLEHAKSNREKVVVFGHIPVYPAGDVHNLWNSRQIVDVLESQGNVVAYVCGHNHAGSYGEKNGVAYITMPAMVEGETQSAYAVVDVSRDGLSIAGRGSVPDRHIAVPEVGI